MANASDPYVTGPAAALVQAVSGLDSGAFDHPLDLRPASLSSSSPLSPGSLGRAASAADATFFQSVCFTGLTTENHTTYGTYPKATYKGNGYYSLSPGCGYSPSNVYGAYNLNGLYAEGYNGAGQTIVIIDWCGSPTILAFFRTGDDGPAAGRNAGAKPARHFEAGGPRRARASKPAASPVSPGLKAGGKSGVSLKMKDKDKNDDLDKEFERF